MDYKEKYENAVNELRNLRNRLMELNVINADGIINANLERIFPELRESEDEKIRKEILEYFSQFENGELRGVDISSWIAWLKKQGEQKPVDKPEPKFKVGDWIVYNDNLYHIGNISLQRYYECLRIDGTVHTFSLDIDSKSHLWTIQDAKDGDVLADDYSIIIFRKIGNEFWSDVVDFHVGCNYSNQGEINIQSGKSHYGLIKDVTFKPATKEQCDLLFSKMKEAGYEWDAEKKEVRKIERKPTDKAEPKFKVGDVIRLKGGAAEYTIRRVTDTTYYTDGWSQSIERCEEDYELVEQKPVWSEEDEIMLKTIFASLNNYAEKSHPCLKNVVKDEINWLKSLKEKMWAKQESVCPSCKITNEKKRE